MRPPRWALWFVLLSIVLPGAVVLFSIVGVIVWQEVELWLSR